MTVAEFLRWADGQPQGRFELFQGEVIAMAPERARHALVKGEVFAALRNAIKVANLPCRVFPDGMTVVIDDQTSYEPDAAIQCGRPINLDGVTLDAPLLVVEVTSPASKRLDAGGKLSDYFRVASIEHYLIIDTERKAVMHHSRSKNGDIITQVLRDGRLTLDPPGLDIAVADLLPEL